MKRRLIHCSYHKCLTVYFGHVMEKLYNKIFMLSDGYHHFNGKLDEFYQISEKYKMTSINNHSLDLDKLGSDFRITRFIRDPRDLVVSGYFYHKSGVEPWSRIINPIDTDWIKVNGYIPKNMREGFSYSSHLDNLSEEDGLITEIEFRKNHFDSMKQWPISDSRIKLFRYEDILGNEQQVFTDILSHYGVSWLEKRIGVIIANNLSAKKQIKKSKHIRNPTSGQWKNHFTPKVKDYFEQHHKELLEIYNYE